MASAVRARAARVRADQALRWATAAWDGSSGAMSRHAFAADDAAFLAAAAASAGRHDEVVEHARTASREHQAVKELAEGGPVGRPGPG